MNWKAKETSHFRWIEVNTHIKCLVVSLDKYNILYDFNKADMMIRDLREHLEEKDIEQVKVYLEANCSKVKFTDQSNPPEQLSLF